jgi:toxin ParE1/3/4
VKQYAVRLMPEAEADLLNIYRYIRERSASEDVASTYLLRIRRFLAGLETAPGRGTIRAEVREGLRVRGFERAVSIAFIVEDDSVIILRVAYRGQSFDFRGT